MSFHFLMRIIENNEKNGEITLERDRINLLYSKYNLGKEIYSIFDNQDSGILESDTGDFNRKLESLYHKQVELIFKEIKSWTSIHAPNLEIKWDILLNEENLENFYSSLDLQKRFKEIMEAIYLLLEHEQVPNKNKIEGLYRIDEAELEVCAPGILTHLMEYVSFLQANDEFFVAKNQVLKELTKKFVYDHKWDLIDDERAENRREIRAVMATMPSLSAIKEIIFLENEIHYYNAFYNAIAKKFGFKLNQDEFIDPDIPARFFSEFYLYIDENLALRLMDYIVESRIAFIRNEAVIEKLNNMEINGEIESWFGYESAKTIRNNIFDREISSGNYYKDTLLSRQIIYFYTLESLKIQVKINAEIFYDKKNILIISDEEEKKETKEVTLLFCKKTPLFLGFYKEKEDKLFINPIDYIQVVNLDFMIKLSKDTVFLKEVYGFLDILQKEKLISAILLSSTMQKYGDDLNKLYSLLRCVPLSEHQSLFTFSFVKHYAARKASSMSEIFDFLIEFPDLETVFLSDEFFLSEMKKSKKMHGLEFFALTRRFHSDKPLHESNYQLIKLLVSFKNVFPDKFDMVELVFAPKIKARIVNLELPIQNLRDIIDVMPYEFHYKFVQEFILDRPEQLNNLDVSLISNLMDSLKSSGVQFDFLTNQKMIKHLKNIELSSDDFNFISSFFLGEENENNRLRLRKFYLLFFMNNNLSNFEVDEECFLRYMAELTELENAAEIIFPILLNAKDKLNSLQWYLCDIIFFMKLLLPVYRMALLKEHFPKLNNLFFEKEELIKFIELIPFERRFDAFQLPQIKITLDRNLDVLKQRGSLSINKKYQDLCNLDTLIVILKKLPSADHQAAIKKISILSEILKNKLSITQLLDIFQVTNRRVALEIFNSSSFSNQCRGECTSLTKEQLNQLTYELIPLSCSYKNIIEEYNKTPGFLTKEIHASIVAAANLKRIYGNKFFFQSKPDRAKQRRMVCDEESALNTVTDRMM